MMERWNTGATAQGLSHGSGPHDWVIADVALPPPAAIFLSALHFLLVCFADLCHDIIAFFDEHP
jgi:hypothetical protein